MSGKMFLLLLSCVFCLRAEVIHFSELNQDKLPYTFKRDIFSPGKLISAEEIATLQNQVLKGKTIMDRNQDDSEKEIQRSILYEGYIEKNNRIHALISLNGEYFVVGQGEVFMETIKIVKIEKNQILLEVESQPIVVQLKGDSDD